MLNRRRRSRLDTRLSTPGWSSTSTLNVRALAACLTAPDFVKLAEAYGITGLRATDQHEAEAAIARARATDGPVVIDFRINPEENVYPMVPPGGANSQMIESEPGSVE